MAVLKKEKGQKSIESHGKASVLPEEEPFLLHRHIYFNLHPGNIKIQSFSICAYRLIVYEVRMHVE